MENLIIHLETITTLILVMIMCIGLPWLTGVLTDKILNISRPDRDHVTTWFVGNIVIAAVVIFVFGVYYTYISMFNYYTKH